MKTGKVLAVAAATLFVQSVFAAEPAPPQSDQDQNQTKTKTAAADAAGKIGKCFGPVAEGACKTVVACKGQANACQGKNACLGRVSVDSKPGEWRKVPRKPCIDTQQDASTPAGSEVAGSQPATAAATTTATTIATTTATPATKPAQTAPDVKKN